MSGKVTDKAGEPLVGVNVLVKGTNAGTMTDLDGNWTIANVESNAVIVFSSIGFSSREVTVGTKKVINVVLEDDTNFLDEVVVVGYGTARRRDLSGSIASVNYANDKNISTLPNPNALSALSSKVAGFSYAPTSSAAGDNTGTMTIRGKNSIPSSVGAGSQSVNQPMLVIDGVISYGSINSVNTSDIESIDVNEVALLPLTPQSLAERSSGIVPEATVALARKIAAADRIVIAAPFWDMSFPAVLKAFFENMSLYGVTFTDNGQTCTGLCRCKKVMYITTRGMNIPTGSTREQGSTYLQALSSLWGLGEITTVAAWNLDYLTTEEVEGKLADASSLAKAIAVSF